MQLLFCSVYTGTVTLPYVFVVLAGGVYFYTGIYYVALYLVRKNNQLVVREGEILWFGVASLCMLGISLSVVGMRGYLSWNPMMWERLFWACGTAGLGCFDRFYMEMARSGSDKISETQHGYMLLPMIGFMLALSGMFRNDTHMTHGNLILPPGKVGVTLITAQIFFNGIRLYGFGADTIKWFEHSRSVRVAIALAIIGLMVATVDVIRLVTLQCTIPYTIYFCLLVVMAFVWFFMGRFVTIDNEIIKRDIHLRMNYKELTKNQEALISKEQMAGVGEAAMMINTDIIVPYRALKKKLKAAKKPGGDLSVLEQDVLKLNRFVDEFLKFAKIKFNGKQPLRWNEMAAHMQKTIAMRFSRLQLDVEVSEEVIHVDQVLFEEMLIRVMRDCTQLSLAPNISPLGEDVISTDFRCPTEYCLGISVLLDDKGQPNVHRVQLSASLEKKFPGQEKLSKLGWAFADRVAQLHGAHLQEMHTETMLNYVIDLPYAPPPAHEAS